MIGTKVDRKHLGHQHLQRRQGARIGRESQVAATRPAAADLVGPSDAVRKLFVAEPLLRHTTPTPAGRGSSSDLTKAT